MASTQQILDAINARKEELSVNEQAQLLELTNLFEEKQKGLSVESFAQPGGVLPLDPRQQGTSTIIPEDQRKLTPQDIKESKIKLTEKAAELGTAASLIAPSVIPTSFGFAALRAGTALSRAGRLARPVAIGLETAAEIAGEFVNQFTGITPKDKTQLALAAAAVPGAELVGKIGKGLLGATRAGKVIRQGEAVTEARNIPSLAIGEVPIPPEVKIVTGKSNPDVNDLFDAARTFGNADFDTSNVFSRIDELIEQEERALSGTRDTSLIKELVAIKTDLQTFGNKVPLENIRATLSSLNDDVRALRKSAVEGSSKRRGVKEQLVIAFNDSLDNIAPSPASGTALSTVRTAARTFKRQVAVESLEDLIIKNISPPRQGDNFVQLKTGAIIKALESKSTAALRRNIKPNELKDIKSTLLRLGKTPKLAPQGKTFRLGTTAAVTGAGATLAGFNPIVGPVLAVGGELLGDLLLSDTGRKAINKVLIGDKLSIPQLSVLAILAKEATSQGLGIDRRGKLLKSSEKEKK